MATKTKSKVKKATKEQDYMRAFDVKEVTKLNNFFLQLVEPKFWLNEIQQIYKSDYGKDPTLKENHAEFVEKICNSSFYELLFSRNASLALVVLSVHPETNFANMKLPYPVIKRDISLTDFKCDGCGGNLQFSEIGLFTAIIEEEHIRPMCCFAAVPDLCMDRYFELPFPKSTNNITLSPSEFKTYKKHRDDGIKYLTDNGFKKLKS